MENPLFVRFLALTSRLGSCWRITLARASGVHIGRGCEIGFSADLQLGIAGERIGSIVLGENCRISQGVLLHPYGGSVRFDNNIFLGPYVVIYGHGGVTIGQDTLISMHCRILSSNHTIPHPGTIIRSAPDKLLPTRIGRDVWLGAGVTVLGGVTIGDGCVVGAGAVVTRDLPANSFAHGVPAVVRAQRT